MLVFHSQIDIHSPEDAKKIEFFLESPPDIHRRHTSLRTGRFSFLLPFLTFQLTQPLLNRQFFHSQLLPAYPCRTVLVTVLTHQKGKRTARRFVLFSRTHFIAAAVSDLINPLQWRFYAFIPLYSVFRSDEKWVYWAVTSKFREILKKLKRGKLCCPRCMSTDGLSEKMIYIYLLHICIHIVGRLT